MALLGRGGILELSREWPDALALEPTAINISQSMISITIQDDRYWTGDRVWIAAAGGLPIDVNGNGFADCPEGHGIYRGSFYALGPARSFYTGPETNENGPHYQASDAVGYYNTNASTGFTTITSAYIHRDILDRIRLFSTEIDSYNEATTNEIPIRRVASGNFVIAPYSTAAGYQAAITSAANSIRPLDLPETEQLLSSVITLPPVFASTADSPEARGWRFQGMLREWAMDLDASALDMTAIGETFGESTKALVKGAGSLQFVMEHMLKAAQQDPLTLLRLVLLTQQGSKSSARFYVMRDRDPSGCGQLGGNIYYECDILLSSSRLNLRADNMVEGSADFVITGTINLKVESESLS